MLSRSKWVAEKECNFNYAINLLLAGTDSYQRADRISFLTLMKYNHSGFNLQLAFLLWCSRGWKTPSPFSFGMKFSCLEAFICLYYSFCAFLLCEFPVMISWCLQHSLPWHKQSLMPCLHIWVWKPHANCCSATCRELCLMSAWGSFQAQSGTSANAVHWVPGGFKQ